MQTAGIGLAEFHCRYHIQHRARHGSFWQGTYKAADLTPYVSAARLWIKENDYLPAVLHAVSTLANVLQAAGPAEIATRLRGMPPQERAKVALARLRNAEIAPARILGVWFATAALIEEDADSHRTHEFRTVQVAKAVHRLASGHHQKWEIEQPNGLNTKIETHAYPRSSGRVLRYLGDAIEEACSFATDNVADVLARKIERSGPHPSTQPGWQPAWQRRLEAAQGGKR